jgi:S1-C subfamily serine protease
VQLFTEPHADYHRPGDTAEKVDAAGLVKVATVAKEAVAYLADRKEPLHATITRSPADAAAAATAGAPTATAPAASSGGDAAAPGGRRVSFGVVPDFGFSGPGARASGVVPGSPAEKAGVQAGDVILRIDGRDVSSLQGFAELLRSLSPGQTVEVVVRRGADEKALTATLAAR